MYNIQKSSNGIPPFNEIKIDPVDVLPPEIVLTIFSYLNTNSFGKCYQVSKKWRTLASDEKLWKAFDLRKISPLLKIFDESDWTTHVDLAKYGLSVDDASPLDKRTAIPALKKCLSLPIEGNAGITLLTIPKGLTFNKLVELAGLQKVVNTPMFESIDTRISNEIGNISVDKTYRIVITNNVLKGSRNLIVSLQKELVKKIGCEMPKTIEAIALFVVTYMSSGKRLYDDNPLTFTRCAEHVTNYQLVVGGFTSNGLGIHGFDSFDYDFLGVGGVLRKF